MSMINITGTLLFSLQTLCVFWDMARSHYNDGLGIMRGYWDGVWSPMGQEWYYIVLCQRG